MLYPAIENSGISWVLTWRNYDTKHHYMPYNGQLNESDFIEFEKLPKTLEKYGFTSIEDVKNTGLKNPVTYEPRVPTLIEKKCTKCELCVRVCPYFAIELLDKITFDENKCFGCGLCISKCPTKALK